MPAAKAFNTLSAKGAAFIAHHEGFVPRYYLDPVNVGTIGIGFTWASAAFRTWWETHHLHQEFGPGATMTRAEAEAALPAIVAEEYGAAVNRFLGKKVAQNVYDAMVSVDFNLGNGALNWKWASAIKDGDLARAAELLRKTGTTAQGKTLPGLITRRREEAELLLWGDYAVGRVYADPHPAGEASPDVLRRGDRGEPVMQLQRALKQLALYDGAIDGLFGRGTEAAVVAFQTAYGLIADGIVGAATVEKLGEALQPAPLPAEATAPAEPEIAPTDDLAGRDEQNKPKRGVSPVKLGLLIFGVVATIAAAVFFFVP